MITRQKAQSVGTPTRTTAIPPRMSAGIQFGNAGHRSPLAHGYPA